LHEATELLAGSLNLDSKDEVIKLSGQHWSRRQGRFGPAAARYCFGTSTYPMQYSARVAQVLEATTGTGEIVSSMPQNLVDTAVILVVAWFWTEVPRHGKA